MPRREPESPPDAPRGPYLAVFLLFAPVGLLIALIQTETWGWGIGIATALFSGFNAVLWSYPFIERKWWAIPFAALMPIAGPWFYFLPLNRLGLTSVGAHLSEDWKRLILGVMAVAFLASGFTILSRHIRRTEARAARADAELRVARTMHDAIVPAIAHDGRAATVRAVSRPSSEMGGDLVDFIEHPDGSLDLLLADVSGHGVAAGLVMGMLKGASRTRLLTGAGLGELASDLNRVLHGLTPSHTFVTAAFMRVRAGGVIEYTLAGHLPIYIRRDDGRVQELENEALPLGIAPDESFPVREVIAGPRDTLIVFTDGLMEVQSSSGEQLGLDALRREIERAHGTPDALVSALMDAAKRHGPSIDDQSVLVVGIR